MSRIIKLLLVEDDEDDYIITRDLLDELFPGRYQLDWARTVSSAQKLLARNQHDVCLLDYSLGAEDGVWLLKQAQQLGFNNPVIMLTGQDNERLDAEALAAGAVDYLVKSQLTAARLARAIRYAISRREMETEKMERMRAEAENRAKSEFLAHLSHELRTPLTSILGYTDLLAGQLAASANGETGVQAGDQNRTIPPLNTLRIIKRNGHHLLSLLNDVLDLSKIEAGKLEIDRHPFAPAALLADLYWLLQVQAQDKAIGLYFSAPLPLPVSLETDPTRLRQILLNLLANAIKFTDAGNVTLTVRVENRGASARLICTVADTGIGITEPDLAQLFKPFAQAGNAATRKETGTGLGLAISQQLARMLEGDIQVASMPGQGSVFTLQLPVVITGAESTEPLDLSGSDVKLKSREAPAISGHLLIADDVDDICALVGHIVVQAGASVAFARDGQDALLQTLAAEQSEQPFDLVIMDMQMPGMSGLAAARQLRERGFTKPIVALTAATLRGEAEHCLAAGCNEHLSKPVEAERLIRCLQRFLPLPPAPVCGSGAKAPAGVSPRHLLLVEDDKDAATVTCLLIESLGCKVTLAHSGRDAQAAMLATAFDLVLMDIQLPDMSGFDLALWIQKTIAMPPAIVALSGHEFSSAELAQSPFQCSYQKPVDMDKLRRIVNTVQAQKPVDNFVDKKL